MENKDRTAEDDIDSIFDLDNGISKKKRRLGKNSKANPFFSSSILDK